MARLIPACSAANINDSRLLQGIDGVEFRSLDSSILTESTMAYPSEGTTSPLTSDVGSQSGGYVWFPPSSELVD